MKKNIFLFVVFLLLAKFSVFSQTAQAAFNQACNAYRLNDWENSQILFRKAVAYPENSNEETYFMLVSSEIYAGNYAAAIADCSRFLSQFPYGRYVSHVKYQRGRAFYCTGVYSDAVLAFSDFCHEYPDHELYPSALYWIAESFFADYSYDEAARLYLRIVSDFPESEKAPSASYRLESIAQREREEKLLYLLQQTGEEYLFAREEYERQLRTKNVNTASDTELRRRITELQNKNSELEVKTESLQRTIDIFKLKQRALEVEKIIGEEK